MHAVTGHGGRPELHRSIVDMLTGPINVAPVGCGLYEGAPAVAYALAFVNGGPSAEHVQRLLDSRLTALTQARLEQAHARIERQELPALGEFYLVSGLTGLGAYHLRRQHEEQVCGVLTYLVRLTEPLSMGEAALPGWWTSDGPTLGPDPEWPQGHGNLGMAHGISGPRALLATAARRGYAVPGHETAIIRICRWLDRWRVRAGERTWWPPFVTAAGRRRSNSGPTRPSWCYGTPGLARAQQLAGLAIGDRRRQHEAEQALAACLGDERQLALVTDPFLCHGWAGIIQTTRRVAEDAAHDGPTTQLSRLHARLDAHMKRNGKPEQPGFMDGIAGIELASCADPSGWDECLLLTG